MEENLKNQIIDSIINKNVTQTAASKQFNISQPEISVVLKNAGYISIVDNGKRTYFKINEKNDDLLKTIDLKLSLIQDDVSKILLIEKPLKKAEEPFRFVLRKTYNKSLFDATSKRLITKTKRRTFRVPDYILTELDNYLLEEPEKFSVFISSLIVFGIQNCRLDKK